MKTIELRTNIHKIVDSIESEQLLKTIYDFLKIRETGAKSSWESLSEDQKKEILLAFDESEDEKNLVDLKSIFKKS